jgi:hypothetical protein
MFAMSAGNRVAMILYTDAYIIRGTVATRHRRITDILNGAEHQFLVLEDATMDEFGSRELAQRTEYAQVNLGAVLFAVSAEPVEPLPELRTPKIPEQALISIPPFKITGRIHLLPERSLADALEELTGTFVPVTEATIWSDVVSESRQTVAVAAVNHARAQILAPFQAADPWAGLQEVRSSGDRPAEPSVAEVPDRPEPGGAEPDSIPPDDDLIG